MPLRDHFRSPVEDAHSWDELHGMWPAVIVQHLSRILPEGYIAAPHIHLGGSFEIDVAAFREERSPAREHVRGDADEYEVRVYDARRGRRLVAAIELVSPSNKDRPASRRAFVAKVASLLLRDVCVSIVDLVTIRRFNLYADLLDFLDANDPLLGPEPSATYAVTARGRRRDEGGPALDTWYFPMEVGRALPTLPIWLDDDLGVSLDLEFSYEEACRTLRIA